MTLRKAFWAGLIVACIGTASLAQPVSLTPDQMRQLSASLLDAGELAEAAAVADLLLERDPEDVTALILRTQVALEAQDSPGAAYMAGRAYRATDNSDAKFVAARYAARAHAEQQNDTRAQIWLRRARQYAPSDAASESIAQDYQILRQRNPWATTLRFGITPSSNINNGSANETTQLFGLPFDFVLDGLARALSGYEISGGFSSRYRLNLDQRSATFFDIDAQGRTYWLSNEAQEQAPDAKGSDFSDAAFGFGITHRQIFSEGALPTTFNIRVGQTWYAGDPYTRTFDFGVRQNWSVGESSIIGAALTAQDRRSLQDDPLVQSYGLDLSWGRSFDSGNLRLTTGYSRAKSEGVNNDYETLSLGASFDFANAINGLQFGIGASATERRWDVNTYAPGAREDKTASVNVRVVLTEIEYYGFQPVVTVAATRTDSNIGLFDRDYLRMGFDLQSSF